MKRIMKWINNIKINGIRVGNIYIMSIDMYYRLVNYEKTVSGIIDDKNNEIERMKKEINLYKTLLDSSEQMTRNYKNGRI